MSDYDDDDVEYTSQSLAQVPVPQWVAAVGSILACIAFVYLTHVHKQEKNEYYVCSSPGEKQIYVSFQQLRNGTIGHIAHECMLVSEGIVGAVGSANMVRGFMRRPENDAKYLQPGHYILPGFIDAHGHLLHYGELASNVNVRGSKSVKEVRDHIAKFIENNMDGSEVIFGFGWDQNEFNKDGKYPDCKDLDDPRFSGKKIVLKRIDEHAAWVSCNILDGLQLPGKETEVEGGEIVRSPNGNPIGIFVDNAMDYLQNVVPVWSDDVRSKYLQAASQDMLKYGLVGVHDAGLTLDDIDFLIQADKNNTLDIRVYGMIATNGMGAKNVTPKDKRVKKYQGNRFSVQGCKIFLDGAIGSWGAAMIEPYSDRSDSSGSMLHDKESFRETVQAWNNAGFQVNSHGIGDRATRMIIDVYEEILQNDKDKNKLKRFRMEHAQILTPEDINRVGELGIIASIQPTHATSDMGYVEKRIGKERIKGAYAWRSLRDVGTRLALGSDFPVESVDPRRGIHAAVKRTDYDTGDSPQGPGGWYPEEALSMDEALHGFTLGAAYAAFDDKRIGRLVPGNQADFLLVDRDPLIHGGYFNVLQTVIDGKTVYKR